MRPSRFVIAGNGATAWLVASALAGVLGRDRCSVTVVGQSGAPAGVARFARCDSIQPGPDEVRPTTGISEDLMIAHTGASFTYGIALTGWSGPEQSYFHPFAPAGASFGPVPFPHIVRTMRKAGQDLRFSSFSLASMAAQAGRFTRPVNQVDSVLSTCSYGVHADTELLAAVLRDNAEAAGIEFVEGGITGIEREESGIINAVLLDDGSRIEGDLFLDCSGTSSLLLQHCGDDRWESWQARLPADRFITATIDPDASVAPYSLAQAFDAGWLHYVPTQGSATITVFYKDGVKTPEQATELLSQFAGTEVEPEDQGATEFGRRAVFWKDNCIAMGAAAVRIDPVGSTNLTLLLRGITNLLQLLPGDPHSTVEADEFNRRMQTLCDRARDFAFLHYKLNGRKGEAFWDDCRNSEATEALDYMMDLYRSRGRIVLCDEEPFDESGWVNLFDEHGVTPEQDYRVADSVRMEVFAEHLERMRAAMIDELRRMPLHSDYLAEIGGDS